MCLRELAIVDDTLEALGAPKEYQRLRKWIIRIIIGGIAFFFYKLAYRDLRVFFLFNFDINFFLFLFAMYFGFLTDYSSNVIVLSALISAVILGLVLYLCIHLLCNLLWHCASKYLQCETHKDLLVTYKKGKPCLLMIINLTT